MQRFLLALKIWWRTLMDERVGNQVREVLADRPRLEPPPPAAPAPVSRPAPATGRSDALTLLATLQREARLIDFLKETLTEYSDAEIGAVARDVHRDAGKVLERLFQLRPVLSEDEGAEVRVPADAERFRLLGTARGEPPHRGRLVHHGWEAAICELPAWTGRAESARVLAPAEVELI